MRCSKCGSEHYFWRVRIESNHIVSYLFLHDSPTSSFCRS